MREIKFRGKRKLNGDWVYGSLFRSTDEDWDCIIGLNETLEGADICRVITNTIGQFTGLKDKTGKEIYEGDILNDGILVTWREDLASFALHKDGWMYDHYFGEAIDPGRCEVIGNIYENKELMSQPEPDSGL